MIKMQALRRFRMKVGDALTWINKGDAYEIPKDSASFHEKTERGKRKTTSNKKDADK